MHIGGRVYKCKNCVSHHNTYFDTLHFTQFSLTLTFLLLLHSFLVDSHGSTIQ